MKALAACQSLPTGIVEFEPEFETKRRRHCPGLISVLLARLWRGLALIAVMNHAPVRLRSYAALLEPQFQAQSPPRGLRFRSR